MEHPCLVHETSEGVFLTLTQDGDQVPLYEGAVLSFENFPGSAVEIVLDKSRVNCRAQLPESRTSIEMSLPRTNGSHNGGTHSLDTFIWKLRVALNGKL